MNEDQKEYGVIHEVGDMGLGFTQLPDQKDQKTLKSEEEKNKK